MLLQQDSNRICGGSRPRVHYLPNYILTHVFKQVPSHCLTKINNTFEASIKNVYQSKFIKRMRIWKWTFQNILMFCKHFLSVQLLVILFCCKWVRFYLFCKCFLFVFKKCFLLSFLCSNFFFIIFDNLKKMSMM